MEIVELNPGDRRLEAALPVLRELRDHLDQAAAAERYELAHPEGLQIAAVFDGDDCRAVAGYRIYTDMTSGRHMYVDDLVTASKWRSHGYGKLLNAYLAEKARNEGCGSIQLDSWVQRKEAHRFYFRERYTIAGFHFIRSFDV